MTKGTIFAGNFEAAAEYPTASKHADNKHYCTKGNEYIASFQQRVSQVRSH